MARVISLAFGGYTDPPEVAAANRAVFEFDRAVVADDGSGVCATAAIYSLRMTVPGRILPVAGVGFVSVHPMHRRQGLMRSLMTRQLLELHERQAEEITALHASEGAIYGRFGYGVANRVVRLTIPRSHRALLPGLADDDLTARLVPVEECLPLVSPIYDSQVAGRPGMLHRDDRWFRRVLLDPPASRGGAAPLQCLIVEDGSTVRGYALYSNESHWEHSVPKCFVHVKEIFASDPAAYAGLWQILLDVDLSAAVVADVRPDDEPLLEMLADPRGAQMTTRDQLHVRVVDVDRALAARRYARDMDLVLQVTDPLCPWNEGRWRLRGDLDGASCERTAASADLRLSARELGAVILGGGSLSRLARAGRVAELSPGALAVAAAAFRSDVSPHCPSIF